MVLSSDDLIKLVLALVVGGAIGLERELHNKSAGFRTITLICVGATLITILDLHLNASGRITANIVTGIGFLGAGVILHEEARITGLTTAAAVWLAAGLGIGFGSGVYLLTLVTGALVIMVMTIFSRFEGRLGALHDRRQYTIVLPPESGKLAQLESQIQACNLRLESIHRMKKDGRLVSTLNVMGKIRDHDRFVDAVLEDPAVMEIQW